MVHQLPTHISLFSSPLSDESHPDPNEEDYSNMIYIGRVDDDGKRVGFEHDNGMY